MSKLSTVFVIATQKSAIAELTTGARTLGERVLLAYTGERSAAVNADTAYYLGDAENQSFAALIPTVLELVTKASADLVLVETSKNGRLAAAAAAAALGTSVLADAGALCTDNGVQIKKMVYGGSSEKTEHVSGAAVVCPAAGLFKAAASEPAAEIVDVSVPENARIRFAGRTAKVVCAANLNAADKVVGVGRGFSTEESLSLANDLAAVLSAEIGCTRPLAEEEKWLPCARYIGVSGAVIKPALYIAAGISGQVQHMVGVKDAGTIIAINKDEHAPIFANCDYGIVGDLSTVLPLLTEKLKG